MVLQRVEVISSVVFMTIISGLLKLLSCVCFPRLALDYIPARRRDSREIV